MTTLLCTGTKNDDVKEMRISWSNFCICWISELCGDALL